MNFELTIVVPVFNEEDNLFKLYDELNKFIIESDIKTKVLFVNDGSVDNSNAIKTQFSLLKADYLYRINMNYRQRKANRLIKDCYLMSKQ